MPIKFRAGKIAVTLGIQQMFDQTRTQKADQDSLKRTWREWQWKLIDDYVMCLQFFWNTDSPCMANYTLKRTAIDHKAKYIHNTADAEHKSFNMGNYLGPHRSTNFATTKKKQQQWTTLNYHQKEDLQ